MKQIIQQPDSEHLNLYNDERIMKYIPVIENSEYFLLCLVSLDIRDKVFNLAVGHSISLLATQECFFESKRYIADAGHRFLFIAIEHKNSENLQKIKAITHGTN